MSSTISRRFLGVLGALALVSGACSTGATPSPQAGTPAPPGTPAAATPAPAEKVTIQIWAFNDANGLVGLADKTKAHGDWERYLGQLFSAKYPNVTVEVVPLAGAGPELSAKINASLAAGTPADIIRMEVNRHHANNLVAPDLVEDISTLASQGELDDIDPAIKALFTNTAGKLLGFPISVQVRHLAGNEAVFREANVEVPTDGDWTWEEFEAACAKMVIAAKRWCIAHQFGGSQPDLGTLGLFFSGGCKWLAGDRAQLAFNSPECVETLDRLLSWKQKGYLYPGEATLTYDDPLNALLDGGSATYVSSVLSHQGYYNDLIKQGKGSAGFKYIPLSYPHKAGVQNGGFVGSIQGYQVFKQADPVKRKWVATFLSWLVANETNILWLTGKQVLPARKSGTAPDDAQLKSLLEWVRALGGVNDVGDGLPSQNKLRDILHPAIQSALLGKETSKQVLDKLVTEGNAIIQANP